MGSSQRPPSALGCDSHPLTCHPSVPNRSLQLQSHHKHHPWASLARLLRWMQPTRGHLTAPSDRSQVTLGWDTQGAEATPSPLLPATTTGAAPPLSPLQGGTAEKQPSRNSTWFVLSGSSETAASASDVEPGGPSDGSWPQQGRGALQAHPVQQWERECCLGQGLGAFPDSNTCPSFVAFPFLAEIQFFFSFLAHAHKAKKLYCLAKG